MTDHREGGKNTDEIRPVQLYQARRNWQACKPLIEVIVVDVAGTGFL